MNLLTVPINLTVLINLTVIPMGTLLAAIPRILPNPLTQARTRPAKILPQDRTVGTMKAMIHK